jgi:hypothetical protein
MKRAIGVILVLVVGIAALSLTGCYRQELPEGQKIHIGDDSGVGTIVTDSPSIPLGGAQELDANVRMGAGELTLESGGTDALEADFEYRPASLKPAVSYDVTSGTPAVGHLIVEQPDFEPNMFGDAKNSWALRLATGVPLNLNVDLGAGQGTIRLGGLDLRELTMNMGAGEATVDFSGQWERDVDARIQAGLGQLTLKFPDDVGVRVTGAKTGIGEFTADQSFTAEGTTFVNRAYGEATTTIEVSVQRGIGEVRLETVR